MLYLKSMSLDRFKSFKHASLLFNRGFNCVVGPNGSGKSNICDAILFGLGEGSLRRLRVNRLEYLISSGKKKAGALSKAYVRLEFGGDEDMVLVRGVRSDGKSAYRLNGKRMTRQEVLEVLKSHNVHVDETSTIAQGEINRLINLNSKERGELIELASGIKEFELKKNEALSELGKVGAKISEAQVMLSERLGFLRDLEKEKAAAESYLSMTKRLKVLNYSVLGKRSASIQLTLNTYAGDISSLDSKRKETEAQIKVLYEKTLKLTDERQKLTKMLSENSGASGDINKKLEAIGSELSAIEVKTSNWNASTSDSKRRVDEAQKGLKETDERIRHNDSEVVSLNTQLSALDSEIKGLVANLTKGDEKAIDHVKEATKAVRALEEEVADLQNGVANLTMNVAVHDSTKAGAVKELADLAASVEEEKDHIKEAKDKLRELKDRNAQIEKQLEDAVDMMNAAHEALSKADAEVISLKEQRAAARPRDSLMQDRVRSSFGNKPGFYGTAAELCSYDSKYALAVEAAAGSRLNYFVVESMGVANTIIDFLKKQNLGRATFIPVQELVTEDRRKDGSMTAVVDLLKFEAKFGRVFNYICSDTYLVSDVNEAKSAGVGRHRYVTVSGETVEKSGVLSGGSASRNISISVLEKRIADLEKSRTQLSNESSSAEDASFNLRKEIAAVDIEMSTAKTVISESELNMRGIEERMSRLKSESEKADAELKALTKQRADLENEFRAKSAKLKAGREALNETYNATLKESVAIAKGAPGNKDAERIEAARKEAERTRISIAEMQKESKMLAQNAAALRSEVKEKEELAAKAQQALASDAKRKAELEKSREAIEKEIKSSSKANKESYDRLSKIDTELLAMGKDQGKSNAGLEDLVRRINDIEVKKGQMEVRLNDIKAELAAYGTFDEPAVNEDVEKMEREVNVLNVKISELGNVNLKAPEIYDEKKKSVDEASEKVSTLEAERRAVIAMMEEIDTKKLSAFMATFEEVNGNFSKLYNYVFPEPEKAQMLLEDAKDPMGKGIDVRVENGKSVKRIGSLSGGQKSLISLMLMFSIHMCKPSSMYLFDEIDAALDKENSKKLSQLIKELGKQAQFIVVSHNDSLIVNADAAIGVVKTSDESKAVGIDISGFKPK
ncbi:Chromosome partition protein Smc [uncultured archaeon]|nr:Chromosome partition protein Smc [uncultured archaeon]